MAALALRAGAAFGPAGFRCPGPVWWDRYGDGSYAPLDAEGLAALLERYEEHGRAV
ncbi:hypothetical protein ACIP3B_29570 [Streptomyces anulatus]|uniref:hypothetical protein n=1 Tax=Streptomyces anulatus TaxID=1892 RepID=UPI003411B8AA